MLYKLDNHSGWESFHIFVLSSKRPLKLSFDRLRRVARVCVLANGSVTLLQTAHRECRCWFDFVRDRKFYRQKMGLWMDSFNKKMTKDEQNMPRRIPAKRQWGAYFHRIWPWPDSLGSALFYQRCGLEVWNSIFRRAYRNRRGQC